MELDERVRGGLAAQRARRQHMIDGGARRVGWKLGRDIAEVEALMGSKPVAARGAIAGLSVALELVDVGSHRGDVERLLAANVLHRAFAMSSATPVGPTAGRPAILRVNDRTCGRGRLLDDYADAVRDAAALLGAMGEECGWEIASSPAPSCMPRSLRG